MKKFCASLGVVLAMTGQIAKAQTAGSVSAVKAMSGIGLHKNRINWINWDLNNDKTTGDIVLNTTTNTLTKTYTSSAGYVYTITLTLIDNSGEVKSASPTDYFLNSFPTAYTSFSPANSVISLNQGSSSSTVKFSLNVTVLDPGSTIPKIAKGLVIAGTESISGTGEYYTLKVATGTVKAIDKYVHNNAWSNYNVELQVSDLGKTIKAIQSSTNTGDGKGDVMLLGEGVQEIEVELKGGGLQHIALGIIEDIDYSDAPNSYGIALHSIESNFENSKLNYNRTDPNIVTINKLSTVKNTDDINNTNGQLSKLNKPKLYLGNDVDSDNYPTTFPNPGYAPDFDDNTGINDDDAFVITPAQVNYDLLNHIIEIKAVNETGSTAYLSMWVDKDRNGIFNSATELVTTPVGSQNGTQIIALDLKPLQIAVGSKYYTRLRLSTEPNLEPTGAAPDGEVEDHFINFYQKPYNIQGTIYLDKDAGVPSGNYLSGVEVKLYNLSGNLLGTTTTNSLGSYVFEELAVNGDYKVKIFPTGSSVNVSSTDNTPTDGETFVSINNANRFNVDFGISENVCFKPSTQTSTGGKPVKHGITALSRAGSESNWPMVRTGAWTALESKNTGFVLNRVPANLKSDDGQIPGISNPQKGMIVYDSTNHCLKIYNGTEWKCFNVITCPN